MKPCGLILVVVVVLVLVVLALVAVRAREPLVFFNVQPTGSPLQVLRGDIEGTTCVQEECRGTLRFDRPPEAFSQELVLPAVLRLSRQGLFVLAPDPGDPSPSPLTSGSVYPGSVDGDPVCDPAGDCRVAVSFAGVRPCCWGLRVTPADDAPVCSMVPPRWCHEVLGGAVAGQATCGDLAGTGPRACSSSSDGPYRKVEVLSGSALLLGNAGVLLGVLPPGTYWLSNNISVDTTILAERAPGIPVEWKYSNSLGRVEEGTETDLPRVLEFGV